MDFSSYATKYKKFNFGKWEVPDVEPLNISRLEESTAAPVRYTHAVQLEKEEELLPLQELPRVTTQYPNFLRSRGLDLFNKFYDSLLNGPDAEQLKLRRRVLTHLALIESGFDSYTLNKQGAPAYGYFQFMQGNYKGRNYNNIGKHAGVDVESFRNNPVLLIQAANKLANEFMSSFKPSEILALHKLGWTDNAILAGCWLGGPLGVRRLAFRGIDSSDGADSVAKRIKSFNY